MAWVQVWKLALVKGAMDGTVKEGSLRGGCEQSHSWIGMKEVCQPSCFGGYGR